MRYRVVGPPGYSVTDLKTIEDWMLERRFKAVPGVIDVNGWGGKTKTYEVTIDQNKLMHYGLTVPQVIAGAEQRQHQCRRPDGEFRPPGGGGARRRPDPFDGRHPQHHGGRRTTARRCWCATSRP